MPDPVTVYEVGPRDGLQSEPRLIPTPDKVRLVDLLSASGFKRIEAASFVSPGWVPQMADAAEVMAGIARPPGVAYVALTPNLKGYAAARAANADEVAVFASASEGFSQKNLNCSIEASLARFRPVLEAARAGGVPVRGYVSCVTDCPYDGPTPPAKVALVALALVELGCAEISLGDTIGAGTPATIAAMLEAVLKLVPAPRLAGHYHDTRGAALANVEVSLGLGLRTFDAAIGGLGGCPFAPGAAGNLDTLTLARRMADLGHATGLDVEGLEAAAGFAQHLRAR